jgi:hypothetical protein
MINAIAPVVPFVGAAPNESLVWELENFPWLTLTRHKHAALLLDEGFDVFFMPWIALVQIA